MPAEGELFAITFSVPGAPRGKGAGRAGIIGGRAAIYTDTKTRSEMVAIRTIAAAAMQGRAPYAGAVILRMYAYRPVPPSWSARKRAAALAGEIYPTTKPDYTNYAKMEDAINQIVWCDDAQIVTAIIHKRFAEIPSLRIDVRSVASV